MTFNTLTEKEILMIEKTKSFVKEQLFGEGSGHDYFHVERVYKTALYLAKLLSKKNINTSRIANGLPIGSNIDYADELTLLKSLEGRKKI